ncbi:MULTISPECIES: hypothetical protein [unclassified Tolypothrix]|uniref:hypothetical protein n=1 Tax=unclassified Tolypothrix TaxID=2649714 RepID=UPI0005EAA540|nr:MULTISPECIES: hypothetical protein [unclassified Tolypothrix]BAY90227.1 WD-repeat protein [Microchaete diplosiphon NIES-3275]EKF01729.1 putative WD40-repeat protein [Tolypothrix sp. PCC 7601]MBE9087130.1 hypothetical protein [Tolypothrix sp. LEGE 11397]UYD24423.1 hypothetical protein HGR01_23590 [Tolypothrix sp. PCC 7712]UYD33344.1 hypothetical protein HG267_31085 [Tolypothrix sp. PCC 7601]
MGSFSNSQDGMGNTIAATKRLARAMMVSAGAFSLILASCNSANRQQQVLNLLTEFSSVQIQEIILPPGAETLYTTISTTLGVAQPDVLMVRGLESVVDINELIVSTNLMRDEFRKQFHCPLVLWVNDEILRKLVWLAPDLKDWAASTIRFDMPNSQLVEQTALSA